MTEDIKKKTKWSYALKLATVLFPDKVTREFDTGLINNEDVKNFLFHYGFKQFLSDKIAGIGKGATSKMKLGVFIEYFDLLVSGETSKKVERTKLLTAEQFTELYIPQAIKDFGVDEEVATKMAAQAWNLARKAPEKTE